MCRAARLIDLILWDIVGECEVTGRSLIDILFQLYSFSGTSFKFDGSMPKLFKIVPMSGSDDIFCAYSFVLQNSDWYPGNFRLGAIEVVAKESWDVKVRLDDVGSRLGDVGV